MIKCNVTICGSISRSAQIRIGKENKPFTTFDISIGIPDKSGTNKSIGISVAKDGGTSEELMLYTIGTRVKITGILTFHKKGEILYLNLSASDVSTIDFETPDELKGFMEFRGTLGKNQENKLGKNGKPFCIFTAFATEKNGDQYDYTWVRFIQFGEHCKNWMIPKAGINIQGDLQLSVYNDHLDIGCLVSDITPWDKTVQTLNN